MTNLSSPWLKDPSFVDGGRPIGGQRFIAFGDLRDLYLEDFAADGAGLQFSGRAIPVQIDGLPPGLNGRWAPQLEVDGDQVRLFYTAGAQAAGGPIDWSSFRLHMATMPLAAFKASAAAGGPLRFADQGTLFDDQQTFGGTDTNFAMIDPQRYSAPDGRAYLTYTVVQPAEDGVRPWQEFVRYREVDPRDPTRALGPDLPLVDGWAGGPHDGVAEASELVTLAGRTYVLVSSRAGDKDQRVLAAPFTPGQGPIRPEDLRPVLLPGQAGWEATAVGSTGTAVIDGQPTMVYQGRAADGRFTLGWTRLDLTAGQG